MTRRIAIGLLLVAVGASAIVWRSEVAATAAEVFETVADWSTRLRDLAQEEPATEVDLRSIEGESASVLIAIGRNEGEAAFLLLVSDPSGPSLGLVIPQDLLVAVPGFGEYRTVDALTFGGPDLVALSLTNQFGIRIDGVAALPAGAVSAGLLGPVSVDLSVPLFVEDSDGDVERVLPAGRTDVAPELVEALLVTGGVGDQFEWIQRQGSAWKTVLESIAASPQIADRMVSLGSTEGVGASDLFVTVAGDDESLLATIPVSRADSVLAGPVLIPAPDQADEFVRQRFDHLLIRPEGRPRLEILNGNGRVGTTADIASILVRAGYRVVRTDNADDFDYEDTLIVAQGEHAEAFAREILDLLGRGLLFLEVRAPSGVVDVSIIVGQDIPAGQG